MKSSARIRAEFQDFFREKAHVIVPSVPVVPHDDPTLLFTNAGMNPFKPVFLGQEDAFTVDGTPWRRVANTQRCIRVSGKHNDLEEVGHDTYHHTLFEMLGNWSFGDYFKEEAIAWAWELLVQRWGLQPDRLYATVFGGDAKDGLDADEEAASLWTKVTSIPPSHVLRFGKKDNFWEMGESGPCGPCSEIHVDLRPDAERAKVDGATLVNTGDPSVMEIWNLVFIQFNRLPSGELKTLPAKHVDTGMGFERICAVIQGKSSNYDTDVFTPIIGAVSGMSGIPYGKADASDIAMRVIADHIRAVSFAIADGAAPSNDGRGYVVRRILRRAIRYGWDKLGLKQPFMHRLVPVLSDTLGDVFPEIRSQADYVARVIRAEEEGFLRTLGQGIQLFTAMAEGKSELSGDDAFKLHDTYGFPIDLTALMAREQGLDVDLAGFEARMAEQKSRARAAGKFGVGTTEGPSTFNLKPSTFTGYAELTSITGLNPVEGFDKPAVILEKTPFYAESGGQVADTGMLIKGGDIYRVVDVRKKDGVHVHILDRLPDDPSGEWEAIVDVERRREIRKHHSATHLLHAALRRQLGAHVAQKGSLVDDTRLRFDFSHFEAIHPGKLASIEDEVNRRIQDNIPVVIDADVALAEAKNRGAMMLFGEKYGEKVRVVTMDPAYSIELCGGTHVDATGEIGLFRFLHESSAAAGVRRVEAVTGSSALQHLNRERERLQALSGLIGASSDPIQALEVILAERKSLEKELETLRLNAQIAALGGLIAGAAILPNGVRLVKGIVDGATADALKQLGYESLRRSPVGTVTVLGSKDEATGKVVLMAAVTDDLVRDAGLKAGALVGQLARTVGGGGGGQPNLATAGGRLPEKLSEALDQAAGLITG
jgi:alanyl-tRNA synthetase